MSTSTDVRPGVLCPAAFVRAINAILVDLIPLLEAEPQPEALAKAGRSRQTPCSLWHPWG